MLPTGPICKLCRRDIAYHPSMCPECGQLRPIAYPSTASPGVLVCAGCAGQPSVFACPACGSEAHPYGSRCARCTLRERLTVLLTDPSTGAIHAELAPVFDLLIAADRPQTTLWWLIKKRGAAVGPTLLGRMARREVAISHDTFRALPYDKPHKYLRDLLVAAGVLDAYQPLLESMDTWLTARLADLPADHADLISRYARWKVMRGLRANAERGQLTLAIRDAARSRIKAAVALLDHFARHGVTAVTATQSIMEVHIAGRRSVAANCYEFVGWLRTTRTNTTLRLPANPEAMPNLVVGHEQRWRQAGRLLHEDTISPYVRVAGLFVLLFAQPVTRIMAMRTNQVSLEPDGRVLVTFADTPIQMPAVVDTLIRDLLSRGATPSYTRTSTHWLFPGRNPGRAMTEAAFRLQMDTLDISPKGARHAALFQLASQIPAPVLADLVGITDQTAVKWAALAARDWASYIAQRAEQSPH